jgi:hypothetical protein
MGCLVGCISIFLFIKGGKFMRKSRIFSMLLVLMLLLSTITAFADSSQDEIIKQTEPYVTVNPDNVEELAASLGIDPSKIISVKTFTDKSQNKDKGINGTGSIQPLYYGEITLRNIRCNPGAQWGVNPIATDYVTGGPYGSNFSKTYTQSIQANYSYSVSSGFTLPAATVTASLGFDVTSYYARSDTYSTSVPANKNIYVRVYPIYDVYNYDIYKESWGTPLYEGYGIARYPSGLAFITVDAN